MHKTNGTFKKAAALGAAALLTLGSTVPAFAATSTATTGVRFTDSVIDTSEKGSITIYKIIENNGQVAQADGTQQDIDTDANGSQSMTVATPNRPEGADSNGNTEEFNNTNSDHVYSDTQQGTFNGSENGKSNGNSVLEGGQGATGHTDSGRDNETYDGDESSQSLVVPDVGFSYRKVADIVTVAGKVNRQNADGSDETTDTETSTQDDSYTGVGLYYTNLDQSFLDLGADFGITPEATTLTDADGVPIDNEMGNSAYYTAAAIENYIAKIENLGTGVGTTYADETGASALTNLTKYGDTKATDHAVQSEDKAYGNFALTDAEGKATVTELPLGLYLIGETDITHHDGLDDATGEELGRDEDTNDVEFPILKNRAEPFLVSVPATNVSTLTQKDETGKTVSHNPGTVWVYDQYVYPKDSTVNISKAILDPDESGEKGEKTLRTREDYQIGDTINQVIWADAPVPQPAYDITADTDPDTANTPSSQRAYQRYRISDKMESSLSFDGVTKVAIINKVANPKTDIDLSQADGYKELTEGTDYIVTAAAAKGEADKTAYTQSDYATRNLHDFTVALTADGLAKLNAIKQDSQVVVFFDATLNKDAMIGPTDGAQDTTTNANVEQDANMNQPTLDFKDSAWPESEVKGNKVYVFTHELDVKKDGLSDPTKAEFVVTRKNDAKAAADNVTNAKNVTEGPTVASGANLTEFGRDSIDTTQLAHTNSYYKNAPTEMTGHLAFVKEADGVYHLYDNALDDVNNEYSARKNAGAVGKTDDASYDTLAEGTGNVGDVVTVLHPDKNGKLLVKGLDAEANTYTLKEIATENGHNLLSNTFDVNLAEVDKTAQAGSDTYKDEDVWKDGRLVSVTANMDDEDSRAKIKNASCVSIGDSIAPLSVNQRNNGIVELEVDNYKAITLRTGGTGRMMIYLIAGAGVVALVIYAAKSKKKAQKTA